MLHGDSADKDCLIMKAWRCGGRLEIYTVVVLLVPEFWRK